MTEAVAEATNRIDEHDEVDGGRLLGDELQSTTAAVESTEKAARRATRRAGRREIPRARIPAKW